MSSYFFLRQFVEYGARSQEPPQLPTSSRSLTPTVTGLSNALTAGLTSNLGLTSGTVTPTTTLESVLSTTTTVTTPATSTATPTSIVKTTATAPLPKVSKKVCSFINS